MSKRMKAECVICRESHNLLANLPHDAQVSYTRHTSRSLMLWLLTLPFALWPVMGASLVPACFFVAYVLIGIDELGVQVGTPPGLVT